MLHDLYKTKQMPFWLSHYNMDVILESEITDETIHHVFEHEEHFRGENFEPWG